MANTKATVSDADAIAQARATLEGLALRMEDGEARSSFYLLTAYWKIAAKKAERGNECGSTLHRHPAFDTYHALDEDGRALCLAEDTERPSGLTREVCEDCAVVARQLAAWKL